jgi:hypothetical protein
LKTVTPDLLLGVAEFNRLALHLQYRRSTGCRARRFEESAVEESAVDSKLKCPVFVASEMSGFGFCFR